MRPNEMHSIAHRGCHQCAPRDWRKTPNVTGDYDLDATILHRRNKDLAHRLELYTKRSGHSYTPRTAYNSIHTYTGDD